MKSMTWLRIAAGLTVFQALGHTFGAVLAAPTQGAEEVALREAMRGYRVTAMGMERSYWDLYFGSGWTITAFLLTLASVMWCAAYIARDSPAQIRPLLAVLLMGFGVLTVVCAIFFITAPIVISAAITVCLGAAWLGTRAAPGGGAR